MNVLSLFDGMSCGRIALKELGITPNIYYASEIDKHAIAQTQLNFPDTVQLGSVTEVDVSKLEPIDLLIGGSPCQSFSFAGRRNGMTTTEHEEVLTLERYLELKEQGFEFEGQSYLFWEYMRILTDIRKYNPQVLFLLENVEMGKKWEAVLSHAIGLYGVHINSALVSAQNRKRIYWTNIRTRKEGLFGEVYTDIPQPEDRGLLLKDILEQEVDEKYYLSEKAVSALIAHRERNKENGNGFGAVFHEPQEKMGALKVGGKNIDDLVSVPYDDYNHRFPDDMNKVGAVRQTFASSAEGNGFKIVELSRSIIQRPRGLNTGAEHTDKSPTLSTHSWEQNNLLCISSSQSHATVSENKSTPLVAAGGMGEGHVPMIANDNLTDSRIRRLTPTECARLQTVPEWYRWECSETQQYKMCGNGWTIEVIKHIFSFMNL